MSASVRNPSSDDLVLREFYNNTLLVVSLVITAVHYITLHYNTVEGHGCGACVARLSRRSSGRGPGPLLTLLYLLYSFTASYELGTSPARPGVGE